MVQTDFKHSSGPYVEPVALPYPTVSAIAFICCILITGFCLFFALGGALGAVAPFTFFASLAAIFGFRYQTLFIAHKLEARMIAIECHVKGVEIEDAMPSVPETPHIDLASGSLRAVPRKPGQA